MRPGARARTCACATVREDCASTAPDRPGTAAHAGGMRRAVIPSTMAVSRPARPHRPAIRVADLEAMGGEERARLADQLRHADRACARNDPHALRDAVRRVIELAPRTLAIDLVAVAELAVHDPELATLRWTHLRPRLGRP
jgi:hypothetical protein